MKLWNEIVEQRKQFVALIVSEIHVQVYVLYNLQDFLNRSLQLNTVEMVQRNC